MRFINSKTLKLEEFVGDKTSEYVILSHTWGDEEVTLKDMQGSHAKEMKGFAKIEKCCAQAARDGFEYVWVDTCCIDKTSSAELSEAINSMYKWYQYAEICYAYLADITMNYDGADLVYPQIQSSKWFTRGWTLQELIAPRVLEFYDMNWVDIGTKRSRKEELSRITGIDLEVLEGGEPWKCNVAQRMSWVAERLTTREEDIAYCLMGLFDVNMPLLYGEGEQKAFRRLQEEILKATEDYTLFAWLRTSRANFVSGLLADSPEYFGNLGDVPNGWRYADLRISSPAEFSCQISTNEQEPQDLPPYITSRGLRISLSMGVITETEYWACLFCPREQSEELLWPCVRLAQLEGERHVYHRISSHKLTFLTTEEVRAFKYTTISVRFAPSIVSQWASVFSSASFDSYTSDSLYKINLFPDPVLELRICDAYPSLLEDEEMLSRKMLKFSGLRYECAVAFQGTNSEIFFIDVAISKHGPSCKILLATEQQGEQSTIVDLVSQVGKTDRDVKRLPSGNSVTAIWKYRPEHSLNVYLQSGGCQDESRS